MSLHDKFNAVRKDLNSVLIDREVPVDLALMALLTREHLLFLGPPGTAKSLLVRELCSRIQGGSYFEKLLTKFSTPEELFGPLSLTALENDKYQRIIQGTVVDSHIAFLDECYKANSAILNSLLTLVNERLYQEGGSVIHAPLISLFGASNETPEDSSLGALHDRFLFRYFVPYLSDDASFKMLLQMGDSSPSAFLSLEDIEKAQKEVQSIPVSSQAIEAVVAIKHEADNEGLSISDRRWRACMKALKAFAWLQGDSEATDEHCSILIHILWSLPDQIRTVERLVAKVTNPLSLEAVELEDAARDLYNQKPAKGQSNLIQALEPLLRQLGDIQTRLESRITSSPNGKAKRAKTALENVAKWRKELGMMALQSINSLAQPTR